ncbi:MAG: S-methyl-5'-thioadenosine phosphorylase [Micropruina sp.]
MRADIGIIGGSGLCSFFADAEKVGVRTPFGEPSARVAVGTVAGRTVAFLPRHGLHHQFPPHRSELSGQSVGPARWGCARCAAPCAVGSLRADLAPGTFVVPDQVVDRTWGREHTIWDAIGRVVHTSFADPYCARGRAVLLGAGRPAVDGGTLVVINGPRFSTRAESQWHAAAGWSVVGMTGMPEASIARDLAMCFSTVCLVTDADAGVEGPGVSRAEVMRVFAGNIERSGRCSGRRSPPCRGPSPTRRRCAPAAELAGRATAPFELP